MVGVVGSNPIVPTNSKKGRASDPFFWLACQRIGVLEASPVVFPSDFGPVESEPIRCLPLCGRPARRVAFLAHPNPCGLWYGSPLGEEAPCPPLLFPMAVSVRSIIPLPWLRLLSPSAPALRRQPWLARSTASWSTPVI